MGLAYWRACATRELRSRSSCRPHTAALTMSFPPCARVRSTSGQAGRRRTPARKSPQRAQYRRARRRAQSHQKGAAAVRSGVLRIARVRPLEEIEAELIRCGCPLPRGQTLEVARKLQIGRSTLYRKLEALGLQAGGCEAGSEALQESDSRGKSLKSDLRRRLVPGTNQTRSRRLSATLASACYE